MTPEFFVTTAAIVTGPVVAVYIAWWLQMRTYKKDRKMWILRALLSTRRMQLSADRVIALNLVEVEFYRVEKVLSAYKPLMNIYGDRPRWENKDPNERKRLEDDLGSASTKLIEEIGKNIGFAFQQLDILRGGYAPEAYEQRENQEFEIRDYLLRLKRHEARIPIALYDARHPQKVLDQAREAIAVMEAAQVAEKHNDP